MVYVWVWTGYKGHKDDFSVCAFTALHVTTEPNPFCLTHHHTSTLEHLHLLTKYGRVFISQVMWQKQHRVCQAQRVCCDYQGTGRYIQEWCQHSCDWCRWLSGSPDNLWKQSQHRQHLDRWKTPRTRRAQGVAVVMIMTYMVWEKHLSYRPESVQCLKEMLDTVTGVWLCCPLTMKPGTVCDTQVGDILHLWSGSLHEDRTERFTVFVFCFTLSSAHYTEIFSVYKPENWTQNNIQMDNNDAIHNEHQRIPLII